MIFKIGKNIFDSEKKRWKGNPDYLLSQIIKLTEEFLSSDKIKINSEVYSRDENKRKLILIVNMDKIIRHLMQVIKEENTTEYELVFDDQKPMRSTADLWSYNTTRTCENYSKTHINLTVYDSQWEQFAAQRIQKNKNVISFVKNDHLNFFIPYQFNGASRKYYLDFIIKLKSGEMLLLEIKGQRTEESDEKAKAALDWVRAVNSQASFGKWRYAVAYQREEIDDILEKGLWDGGE